MDTWVWWPTVILMGAAVGSFLNVAVYRLPHGMSLWSPPSHCPTCQTPLTSRDNIPVIGWWLLRGRCRYCQTAISWRYPFVETLCLVLFSLCFVILDWQPALAVAWGFVAWLLTLALIDWDTGFLPEGLTQGGVIGGAVVRLLWPWLQGEGSLKASVDSLLMGIGAAVLGIWLLEGLRALWLLLRHKEVLGLGDGKLLAGIGMILGWWPGVIVTLVVACLVGLLAVAVAAILRQWQPDKGIPFGPYLAVGGLVAMLAGPQLVSAYVQSLGI